MQEITRDALVKRAIELLADGTVNRVLGYKNGEFSYDVTPAIFTDAESIEKDFVYNGFSGSNFSKYLVKETIKDGKVLKHFAIAGEDQKFVWADAVIKGNTVVVSSKDVPNPVAVRYAWADNPDDANLINKEGLLASPFRTDNW